MDPPATALFDTKKVAIVNNGRSGYNFALPNDLSLLFVDVLVLARYSQ